MNHRQAAGQVLPLIAVCLGALMGFAGISVDVGFLEYREQSQQTATDSAALGGAEVLAHSSCSNAGPAQQAAVADASGNGFSNGGNIGVTAHSPPQSGPFASNSCAIGVQIAAQHTQTFFSQLFSAAQGMTETTQAIAEVEPISNGTPCIYLLSTTIDQNFNGANVQGPQCSIYMNSTANFNGSTIDAAGIGYAGGAPNENGAHFTEATPAPMLAIADPCPAIPGCAYLASNAPSTSSCTSFNGNGYNGSLSAGCYSSLNLNGATVTLNGTYVLAGTSNFNGAHITGSNVTIYVTASGTAPNFNGAYVALSPPTSGNQVGVLYYQVPTNTGSANFNGATNSYSGLVYSPGATSVDFNGTGGGYVVLVFGGINFNGTTAQEFATPPPGQALATKAVIVQ